MLNGAIKFISVQKMKKVKMNGVFHLIKKYKIIETPDIAKVCLVGEFFFLKII